MVVMIMMMMIGQRSQKLAGLVNAEAEDVGFSEADAEVDAVAEAGTGLKGRLGGGCCSIRCAVLHRW